MIDIQQIFRDGELFDGHYKLLKPLSTAGGTADVWLALDTNTIDMFDDSDEGSESDDADQRKEDTAMKVAIKIYRPKNLIDIEGEQRFRDEFKKVFNCHHANVIQPTHFSIYKEAPYLVIPYCKDGSSEKLIGKITDDRELWKYISDVASGLAYLHAYNPPIIHQDIKPANVLIDDNHNYAITDFGISAKLGNKDEYFEDESSGTYPYMPPERFIENPTPMPESDIWALGATLFEMITGDVPFGNDGGIAQLEGSAIPEISQDVSKEIKNLVYACLDKDLSKRPTAQGIVELVLNKKYAKNRKRTIIVGLVLLVIMFAFGWVMYSGVEKQNNKQFLSLCYSGDSIVTCECGKIKANNYILNDENAYGMSQAIGMYSQALKVNLKDSSKMDSVKLKIAHIKQLVDLYEEYKDISESINKARRAEMEDEYRIYKSKQEEVIKQMKHKINAI
ncbi:serine/threonine-protein kinase [Phocaeicola sp.]